MSPGRVELLQHPDMSELDNATSRSSPASGGIAAVGSFLLCVLAVFFLSLTSAEEGASAPIIEHGPRGSKMVALTFDACATGMPDEFDENVAAVLLSENVPATLFISGRWAERNPDWVVFLSQQPNFEIANHSFYHPHMEEVNDERVLRELARTQATLKRLAGTRPKYFRPPYGEVDERVARLASQAGLTTVQYDIASGDPDPDLSAEAIAKAVLNKARGGSIVVFHMNNNGVKTKEVLPVIIAGLREKGYVLVTVGELLKTSPVQKTAPREVNSKRHQADSAEANPKLQNTNPQ
jgi:peptidoglycan/xylan/chitin deacetylase (PgdA/CDA1 family)